MSDLSERYVFKGRDYLRLNSWLNENWGNKIDFNNGCTVWLEDDNGMIWRTDPYGLDSGSNYIEGWENSIKEWVKYWDEPRIETGDLMLD